MTDEETLSEASRWVRERPECIHGLMVRFPPGCRAKANRPLVCPRPGEVGNVVSYTEDGRVSVVVDGNPVRGFCNPEWLEVVEFLPGFGPDFVREALGEKP